MALSAPFTRLLRIRQFSSLPHSSQTPQVYMANIKTDSNGFQTVGNPTEIRCPDAECPGVLLGKMKNTRLVPLPVFGE